MTVNEIYQSGLKLLENNNIENSKFEAQSLLQKAFSLDRVGFIMHKTDKGDGAHTASGGCYLCVISRGA
jgi:release factor glutamine methyltransferase